MARGIDPALCSRGGTAIRFWIFLITPGLLAATARLSVPDQTAPVGRTVLIPVAFAASGTSVSAIQFDLASNAAMNLAGSIGDLPKKAGKNLYFSSMGPGKTRYVIVGLNRNVIADGPLVEISVNVGQNMTAGTYTLELSNAVGADPTGSPVPMGTTNGEITVSSGARIVSGGPVSRLDRSAGTAVSGASRCPCSIWSPTTTPGTLEDPDGNAVEIGLKFRSDLAGYVTGVRFYKGPANTGTHLGHLWTDTGSLLATVKFAGETSSGWQQAHFPAPVPIQANRTYIISYHAPAGHYSSDSGYFKTSGMHKDPLHALANGTDGPNGVYAYGSSAFPNQSYNAANYWVDVVFKTAAHQSPVPQPPATQTDPPEETRSIPPAHLN